MTYTERMWVDVWPISLCPAGIADQELDALLSPDERRRAARFHFPMHAIRYRICHAAMRQVLGGYLGVPGVQVELASEPKGKPRLADEGPLKFNLSHSGDLALLAVSDGLEVGVDVEAVRPGVSVDSLASFFTAAECDRLRQASPGEKERIFFRWWTRKEAVLKADGCGLSGGLDQLDISNSPPELVRFPTDGERCWRVEDLPLPCGYAAALAAPPGEWQLRWQSMQQAPLTQH